MRLLLGTPARGAMGGVETYLRGIVPALIARGHEVAMIFEHGASDGGDPYAACAFTFDLDAGGAGAASIASTAIAAARAWLPDLVWLHGLNDAALEAALLEIAPAIAYAHNYDGLCATGAKFRRWPRPHPCGRRLGPACGVINFTRHCGLLNPAAFAQRWRREWQRSQAWPHYQRVLVASRHMAAELERHGVSATRLRRVGYPRLESRADPPTPRSAPPSRVLMLARLTRAKGGDLLLAALAMAERQLGRRLQVTIAGNGPERPRLQTLARRLHLEADFPGWLDADERLRRWLSTDLLAVPSVWPEPFGMTGIEAAGYGIPAVGFAVGGIPDWLHAGDNGELARADPPTATELAQALVRALGDAEHWNCLRRGAWERAAEFALEPHLDQLEAIFHEVVA